MKTNDLPLIAKVAVLNNRPKVFDYQIPQEIDGQLSEGARVLVPLRKKEHVGIVVKLLAHSQVPVAKLKPIISVIAHQAIFTQEQFELLNWFYHYYHIELASAYALALPPGLKQAKQFDALKMDQPNQGKQDTSITLNQAQLAVAKTVLNTKVFKPFLLYGITGSGKTECYIHIIRAIIKEKKQALVLVPEIGLTPQTLARFQSQLTARICMVHSSLTAKKRAQIWQALKQGEVDVIIGTRSAVFFPFKALGFVVVDESHDSSYKQQDRVRYHARDVAIYRAKLNNIPILLGSATPSLESLHNVELGKYSQLNLTARARTDSSISYNVLDIRHKQLVQGISAKLLPKIEETLTKGEQVIVFINRRGFSPVLMCTECGHTMNCDNCDSKLTLHMQPYHLHCHHCLRSMTVPTECSECHADMKPIGYGTQRIAEALAEKFKDYPVYRIDRDTITTQKKLDQVFEKVREGTPCIMVGTQMLAKGHDFTNLSLAIIVNIDASFYSQDFRALEKLGQLIIQVSGRVGRHDKKGQMYLQTTEPTEPHLKLLLEKGYLSFAKQLLAQRNNSHLPPASFMARITADARKEQDSKTFLEQLSEIIPKHKQVDILGPYPATMLKKNNSYRYHLTFRAPSRKQLHIYLQQIKKVLSQQTPNHKIQWFLEVDPLEI